MPVPCNFPLCNPSTSLTDKLSTLQPFKFADCQLSTVNCQLSTDNLSGAGGQISASLAQSRSHTA
ncbi:hypothetical protein [Microcoleus sp. CAWBG58]|uniref:hypothetical protein n=1 Tax=Microcoleus sp. CAWBG58 TaxID=2841651 RepID=UPI0025EDE0B3|nr:hypothetical protein [Microcoleus sp. CAWBG58]